MSWRSVKCTIFGKEWWGNWAILNWYDKITIRSNKDVDSCRI